MSHTIIYNLFTINIVVCNWSGETCDLPDNGGLPILIYCRV